MGDLPESMRALFADLPGFLRNSERSAAKRLEEGEWDHLVFYVLQSNSFTKEAAIDPAASARAFAKAGGVPEAVRVRFRAFLGSGSHNARLDYLRTLQPTEARFRTEYARAMRFLYTKEVEAASREQVAALYRSRGHSSDTAIEASYAVYAALRTLKDARLERVLIVGPGVDFAPRMDLREETPPRTYQPYAVAGSLLALGLARREALVVQCVDLNPRVVGHFDKPQADLPLRFVAEDDDQREFLKAAPQGLGVKVTASRLNIVTQRLAERFDLIVATNMLLYLEDKELALALANIRQMLRPGGYLIHNEQRPEAEAFARVLGMPMIDARMVRLSAKRRLYDAAIVHRAD